MFDTTQETVLAVIGALSVLIGFIVSAVKVGVLGSFIGLLFSIPFLLLSLFNIRCLILGGCNIWAWILTALIGLFSVVGIFSVVELDNLNAETQE